ncbi:MAG: NTP transferase domain-containing protein [Calditrichia bacterium]
MTSDVAVVIPARYAASRLPGKPLIPIAGKPMIQWVYERALQIRNVSQVIVATDDLRIADTVKQFGGVAIMTPENCANGSERVGIVAQQIDADIVVNLQGDEPLISPAAVTQAIMALQQILRYQSQRWVFLWRMLLIGKIRRL